MRRKWRVRGLAQGYFCHSHIDYTYWQQARSDQRTLFGQGQALAV